ncbi:Cna B-type domain-containing protein [Secundilactobacillus similis]|uniref:Cna B-type domain-containing protein n=1 Tax=Secundilactobacillus similis TaxID=414682 RepID=UPI0012E210F5|nr:Cna B-type domain-containing protein [Secundilactobacillus similis]
MAVSASAAATTPDNLAPVTATKSTPADTQVLSTTSESVVDQPTPASQETGDQSVPTSATKPVQTEAPAPTTAQPSNAPTPEPERQPTVTPTYNPGNDVTTQVKVSQQLYDGYGNPIDETYQSDIYDQESIKVMSHFEVPVDLVDDIQAGDYFKVALPDNLITSDTTVHDLIHEDQVVGAYQLSSVTTEKAFQVTFNDFLARNRQVSALTGDIEVHGLAQIGNLDVATKTGGVTDIQVKPRPSRETTANPYVATKELISKQGFQVPDYDGGPTCDVNWILDINTDAIAEALGEGTTTHAMTNTMIYDNLTLGQTVSTRSTPRVMVPIYYRDADGKVLNTYGPRLEVSIGDEVTVAQVAAANHIAEADVTFSQFGSYIKQHLGSYGYFKHASDGSLFDQAYQAGQITFVMNLGDLGSPTATGNQLHLATTAEETPEAQIQTDFPTGAADLQQTLAGYQNLLAATAGSGIAGLHVEFLMHELADVDQQLSNTAILVHDGQSSPSKNYKILYDSTSSRVELTLAKGVIRIQKAATAVDDAGNYPALAGVVFNITDTNDHVVAHLVTDANGIAETPVLRSGHYLVQEMQSVAGYDPVMLADVAGTLLGDGQSYSVTIDRKADDHGILVNVFNKKTPTTTITVTKQWQNVPANVQTPDVAATLYAGGESTNQTIMLTPLNGYTGIFTNLAVTDATGNAIIYSVHETTPVEGYTAENNGVAPVVNGHALLINDYNVPVEPPVKPTTEITVIKQWHNVPADVQTPSVTVTLLANQMATKQLTLTKDQRTWVNLRIWR